MIRRCEVESCRMAEKEQRQVGVTDRETWQTELKTRPLRVLPALSINTQSHITQTPSLLV